MEVGERDEGGKRQGRRATRSLNELVPRACPNLSLVPAWAKRTESNFIEAEL